MHPTLFLQRISIALIAVPFITTTLSIQTAYAANTKTAALLKNTRPDLNGTWENGGGIDFVKPTASADGSICIRDCNVPAPPRVAPDRPKYKPELAAKIKALSDNQVKLDPALRCKPPGVPRIGPPDKIVQTSKEVIFLYEDITGAAFRVITIGGKHVMEDIEDSYFGHSIGHFEGGTLIVDTIAFNDDTWLADNGAIHSTKLHVTEKLRRIAGSMADRTTDRIEYDVLVEDPEVLAEPWHLRPRVLELAKSELAPSVPCVDQDLSHVVDDSHHDNLR